LVNSIR